MTQAAASLHTVAEPPPPGDLERLRKEIDRLDDSLHDLLMDRAAVVAELMASRVKGRIALRPGREAAMLRRLLDRHHGPLPRQAVVRVWRELLAATTGMQGGHAVAVCEDSSGTHALTQLAREHFGALTPLRSYKSAAQVMSDLSSGAASVAVLPMPSESEPPGEAWWTALMRRQDPNARIQVVARLPFWSTRPEGAPRQDALVAACIAPDPSGADRGLLALELPKEFSRARLNAALVAAGFQPEGIVLRRDPGNDGAAALVEVSGFLEPSDPRLAALAVGPRAPIVLGGYAVPVA